MYQGVIQQPSGKTLRRGSTSGRRKSKAPRRSKKTKVISLDLTDINRDMQEAKDALERLQRHDFKSKEFPKLKDNCRDKLQKLGKGGMRFSLEVITFFDLT